MAGKWRCVVATDYQGSPSAVQSALHISAEMRSSGYMCLKYRRYAKISVADRLHVRNKKNEDLHC